VSTSMIAAALVLVIARHLGVAGCGNGGEAVAGHASCFYIITWRWVHWKPIAVAALIHAALCTTVARLWLASRRRERRHDDPR
jgi:hypothetical protein